MFNRGFDRLSHGYGNAADFVIRHSVVMLLVYVVLIGSAGWLLVTTPQGFIPAQDRGYVIVSVQLPGAASLARTTEMVREIERIALTRPVSSGWRRWPGCRAPPAPKPAMPQHFFRYSKSRKCV